MIKPICIISTIIFFYCSGLMAQNGESQRIPLIGSNAPSFVAPSTNGTLSFPKDFGTHWKILFAHPHDFTPVCSSEILELAYRQKDFKELNTRIAIVSVDKMVSHRSWKSDLESIEYKGRGKAIIEFPLIVDSSAAISFKYGMLDSKARVGRSVRGVFIIDPGNVIRAFYFYPNEVGRNINEILRTLKALQAHDRNKNIVLPVNWQPGDDYMLPILSPEDKVELKKPEPDIYYINWYMIYKKGK